VKLLSMIEEIDLGIIQFTAIANDVKLANRILGTVTASATTGDRIFKWTGAVAAYAVPSRAFPLEYCARVLLHSVL
jgi:hypothetical protein